MVKSLPPDKFSNAAILKVLKLRSIRGEYLFLRKDNGGRFFSKITAFRTLMRQVTYSFFKNGVLKSDHGVFAVRDSNSFVYTNFPPGASEELYMKQVNSSGVILDKTEEEFTFTARRRLGESNIDTEDTIILQALLSRADSSNGGITPKLFDYNIRVSY